MAGAVSALYEPLIERDLDAIPAAADAYLREHSEEELWTAVARFAVLAYAPSQHAKRAVMAVRAAHDVRAEVGSQWRALILECARYAAESRPPWSEPPIFDDLVIDESRLASIADGDALLMLETARALEPLLGSKGRAALLRMPLEEPGGDGVTGSLESLVDRAIASKGAVDDVRAVFVGIAKEASGVGLPGLSAKNPGTVGIAEEASGAGLPGLSAKNPGRLTPDANLRPYHLARDYAQTLIAHAYAPRLRHRTVEFLEAVHHNLEHGENYAEWSFA